MNDFLQTGLAIFSCLALIVVALLYVSLKRKAAALSSTLNHQLQNLRHELNTKTNAIELAAYKQDAGTEMIIYDSNASDLQNDFTGQGARAWDYAGHQFLNGEGKGIHQTNDGVINIHRDNDQGRYELYLKKYGYSNSPDKIPADNTISERRFLISCEVKRDTSSHLLRFVFKGETSQNVLDEKDYVAFSPEWETVNLVFTVSTTEACYLRIDDLSVLEAPSGIQIRNLVLYEKR